MHLMPWQFQRNQIRKKRWGNGGSCPVRGDEWITSMGHHQFPPGRDKNLRSWIPRGDSFSEFVHFQVCTFIFNQSLLLSCICVTVEFFLLQRQEPSHRCSGLSPLVGNPVSLRDNSISTSKRGLKPWCYIILKDLILIMYESDSPFKCLHTI